MKFIPTAAIAALTVSRTFAAEAVPADLQKFTRDYLEITQDKGNVGIVPMLHPEAQKSLKEQFLRVYRRESGENRRSQIFGTDVTIQQLEEMPADQFLAKAFGSPPEHLKRCSTTRPGCTRQSSAGSCRPIRSSIKTT